MKKILLIFFVIIFVVCMALPVFAVEEYSFFIPYPSSDADLSDLSFLSVNSVPSVGNYEFEFHIPFYDLNFFFTGICSAYDNGYYIYIPFSFNDGAFFFNFSLWFVYDPLFLAELGLSSPVLLPVNNDTGDIDTAVFGSHLTLEKMESVGFSESINSGLSSVMSWIQSFAHAFISGELSPLLTVFVLGICVAALFFGIRSIYKFCWGC